MSDEEARAAFQRVRWADNGGEPCCPKCGCLKLYAFATRPVWKCSGCNYQFSVTSRTIFADRKRPVRDYLLAIAIFCNGVKGHAALQLSRDLNCQYKTAFVLAHKLREAMQAEQADIRLAGTVEIDGCYVGGHIRVQNKADERIDRRLPEVQTGRRSSVVVMRERGGRTFSVVVPRESAAVPIIRERVAMGSIVHADEASGWDTLHAHYDMRRINHSVTFSLNGACTNQAEVGVRPVAPLRDGHSPPDQRRLLASVCKRDGVARGSSPHVEWRAVQNGRDARGTPRGFSDLVALLAAQEGNLMANEHVLSGLLAKRAELSGQVEMMQKEMRQLVLAIDHIYAAIRLFDPNVDLEDIKPKLPPRHSAFRSEVSRIVLNTLRKADKPLPVSEITLHVLAGRGLNADDKPFTRVLSRRVGACLRNLRRKGLIQLVRKVGQTGLGEIVK